MAALTPWLTCALVAALTGGCARAGSALDSDASVGHDTRDARTNADGATDCTPTTTNLLANPSFDLTPTGTGWVETPIDPTYPIITADATLMQTAPNLAWMGGIARANANDALYQEVVVPAGATSLVLTGYYEVRSGEGAAVFDRGKIELVEVGGAVIEQALGLDNSQKTTSWHPIAVTFGAPHGGETVRLRLSTSSNASNETSFFFDSLALTATSCQ